MSEVSETTARQIAAGHCMEFPPSMAGTERWAKAVACKLAEFKLSLIDRPLQKGEDLRPKRERGIRLLTDSPPQVFVVNAVAASAGRCQRCAPQERCDLATYLCMPGGAVPPPSVCILPSYSSTSGIASALEYQLKIDHSRLLWRISAELV